MTHFVIFEKKNHHRIFKQGRHSQSAPAATRAIAARQRNGCETAFSAARTGNEFRPNRGNASAVTADLRGLTAELIRLNSGINSDLGDAQKPIARHGEGDELRALSFPRALPVLASEAIPLSTGGPPTHFQSRSCRNGLEDLWRRRTRRREISGRAAAAEPGWLRFVRNAMSGGAQWVSSSR